jgi:chromosome segregation ATPase
MDTPTTTRTIRTGDLARLQAARASAQAWVDHCEVDIMEAQQKLDKLLDEQRQARATLQERDEDLRQAGVTVALRRVG